MATSMNFTKSVLVSKLQSEIKNHVPEIDYITARGNQIDIFFTKDLDATEEQTVTDLVNNHTNQENKCKIYNYVKKDVLKKHFHNINYKTEVVPSLFPKRTIVKGEVQKVEYYSDEALTDLVLVVEITYIRNEIGFALERTTTRTWYREDNTIHPELKITRKVYTLNIEDQIKEIKRKRRNQIDLLTIKVLGLMQQTITDKTTQEIVDMGRIFLATHKASFQNYADDGHMQIITDITNATDSWLDNDIGDSTTIREFIQGDLQ